MFTEETMKITIINKRSCFLGRMLKAIPMMRALVKNNNTSTMVLLEIHKK